ncbi:MAG: hypothetical protein WA702_15045 [Bradyrhizobium sp.]|uniref:hypothetical protein n=1 Tax=Bradyrhizobium sp. TaxID=376 RepID=UPI003C7AC7FC
MTNELMFEVLRSIQARLAQADGEIDEFKQEMQASRTFQIALRQEITGIHATLVRSEGGLERIERRLELTAAPSS